MSADLVDRLLSRKLWAYVIGVGASIAYAGGLIDQVGLAAIVAASGLYQVGEGLADLGQNAKRAEAEAKAHVANLQADVALAQLDAQQGHLPVAHERGL